MIYQLPIPIINILKSEKRSGRCEICRQRKGGLPILILGKTFHHWFLSRSLDICSNKCSFESLRGFLRDWLWQIINFVMVWADQSGAMSVVGAWCWSWRCDWNLGCKECWGRLQGIVLFHLKKSFTSVMMILVLQLAFEQWEYFYSLYDRSFHLSLTKWWYNNHKPIFPESWLLCGSFCPHALFHPWTI